MVHGSERAASKRRLLYVLHGPREAMNDWNLLIFCCYIDHINQNNFHAVASYRSWKSFLCPRFFRFDTHLKVRRVEKSIIFWRFNNKIVCISLASRHLIFFSSVNKLSDIFLRWHLALLCERIQMVQREWERVFYVIMLL